jgi:hypothetical protein
MRFFYGEAAKRANIESACLIRAQKKRGSANFAAIMRPTSRPRRSNPLGDRRGDFEAFFTVFALFWLKRLKLF